MTRRWHDPAPGPRVLGDFEPLSENPKDEIQRFLAEPDCPNCDEYPCSEHCGCNPDGPHPTMKDAEKARSRIREARLDFWEAGYLVGKYEMRRDAKREARRARRREGKILCREAA